MALNQPCYKLGNLGIKGFGHDLVLAELIIGNK